VDDALNSTFSSVQVQASIVRANDAISKWRLIKASAPDFASVFLVSLLHTAPRV
jgi:hypothetical protein